MSGVHSDWFESMSSLSICAAMTGIHVRVSTSRSAADAAQHAAAVHGNAHGVGISGLQGKFQ